MPVSNGPESEDIVTRSVFLGDWQFRQKNLCLWMNWFGKLGQQVNRNMNLLERLGLVKRVVIPFPLQTPLKNRH